MPNFKDLLSNLHFTPYANVAIPEDYLLYALS